MARKLPRYPVPVALAGRLAVDPEFQGKGLGAIPLANACRKVVQASAVLAVAGIVVDARDATAARFYAHFGFVPMPGLSRRLLLPAKALPARAVQVSQRIRGLCIDQANRYSCAGIRPVIGASLVGRCKRLQADFHKPDGHISQFDSERSHSQAFVIDRFSANTAVGSRQVWWPV